MGNATEINDVSDTAIWVAYYRGRESDRPDAMFRDPLAKLLTAERGERIARSFGPVSSRTEWTVLMRTVIIDEYILRAIADGVDAVLNLGAGLDTRPYRLDLPAALQWVEADFPHMVDYKNSMLHAHTSRCQLQRVGVDLSDPVARRKFLAEVLPGARRVLVLTEGVIIYLPEEQVAELAADLHGQPRFALWLAEYFSPELYPYLQALARAPVLSNSPFRFFPKEWLAFFRAHGWIQKELQYTTDMAIRMRRWPPMPWMARLLMPFMPRARKERMRRMTGYILMAPLGR